MRQINATSRSNSIHEQNYTPEMTGREFQYFAKSRSCYKLLRTDYELPGMSTLTKLTLKVSNIEESLFVRSLFQTLNDRQKIGGWEIGQDNKTYLWGSQFQTY